MIRKVAIKINKGIKMFGKPLRDGEINELNTRQIFRLLATPAVREIWEFNNEETYKRQIFLENYKDENPDWEKVGIPVLKAAEVPVEEEKSEPAPIPVPEPEKKEESVETFEPEPPVTESIPAVAITEPKKEDNVKVEEKVEEKKEDYKSYNKNNKKNKK